MHIFIFGYKIDVCCLQCIFISSFPIGTQFRKGSFESIMKQNLREVTDFVVIHPAGHTYSICHHLRIYTVG